MARIIISMSEQQSDVLRKQFEQSDWRHRMLQERKEPTIGGYIVHLLCISALCDMTY